MAENSSFHWKFLVSRCGFCRFKGKWTYFYWAVNRQCRTVDFWLNKKRNRSAALQFLRRAINNWKRPDKLTLDRYPANQQAIQQLKDTLHLTHRL